jgi:transcriptional regulator with XRE-family HTH domain
MSKTFGQLIAGLRRDRGLSVYALAQHSGLADQTVHDLEQSDRQPSLDTARRLAAVLGVTLEEMVRELPPLDLPQPEPGRPKGRPRENAEGNNEVRTPQKGHGGKRKKR